MEDQFSERGRNKSEYNQLEEEVELNVNCTNGYGGNVMACNLGFFLWVNCVSVEFVHSAQELITSNTWYPDFANDAEKNHK